MTFMKLDVNFILMLYHQTTEQPQSVKLLNSSTALNHKNIV